MRAVAVAALVPGIAALLVLGLGSLATAVLRMLVGPFVLVAFRLAASHIYPTDLGRLHLVAYAGYQWWTGITTHSQTTRVPIEGSTACVYTIACFLDNYCYCVVDEAGEGPCAAALVDPADADAVLRQLRLIEAQYYGGRGLLLGAVLTTHKHWDHQGGNAALAREFPSARIYGGARDRVSCCTHPVADGDLLRVGSLQLEVVGAPGHTLGSVMYLLHAPQPALFTGDTLFCGGSGALMEGTQADMRAAFARIWRLLAPCPRALLFPGHEYTEELLASYMADAEATPLESASAYARLSSTLLKARRRRAAPGLPLPTVPTCLADELAFNPTFHALHEAASTLAHAYRRRRAREGRPEGEPWRPPAAPEDEPIPTLRPWDLLAPDEPPRCSPRSPPEPPSSDDPDPNPALVLLSADLVRSLMRACEPCAELPESGEAAARRSARASAALELVRLQRSHMEGGADDSAATRSRGLRDQLLERRGLGGEASSSAVTSALELFGLAGGHIPLHALSRALTTLGVDRPLSEQEARALIRDARAIDAALAAHVAAGEAAVAPPDAVSTRALVALLSSPRADEAHGQAPRTWMDRAVLVISRLFPIRGWSAGGEDGAREPSAAPGTATHPPPQPRPPTEQECDAVVLGVEPAVDARC